MPPVESRLPICCEPARARFAEQARLTCAVGPACEADDDTGSELNPVRVVGLS